VLILNYKHVRTAGFRVQGLRQPLCEEVVKGKRLLQAGRAELHHVCQQLGRFAAAHLLRFLEHVPLLLVGEGVGLQQMGLQEGVRSHRRGRFNQIQNLADHVLGESGQHVVEFCCLVHDVAQLETALHEDEPRCRAGLPERPQLDVL
jgi:hypothetical protein